MKHFKSIVKKYNVLFLADFLFYLSDLQSDSNLLIKYVSCIISDDCFHLTSKILKI